MLNHEADDWDGPRCPNCKAIITPMQEYRGECSVCGRPDRAATPAAKRKASAKKTKRAR